MKIMKPIHLVAWLLGLWLFVGQAFAQTIPPPGSTISVAGGDPLTIVGGNTNGGVIQVNGPTGTPLANVRLQRQLITAAGAVLGTSSPINTDANGQLVQGILGPYPAPVSTEGGANRYCLVDAPAAPNGTNPCVEVSVLGTLVTAPAGPKTFTVTAGTVNSALAVVSGNNQTGVAGQALAQNLVAQMTAISGGAPVPNAPVQWITFDSVTGTGGLTTIANTTTDAGGQTQISFVPPNANAGRVVIATFPGTQQGAQFTVNVQAAPTLACAPTFSPNPATAGQNFTVQGNCTINGVAATVGTETWTFPAASGVTPATQTRVLPAAALTPVIASAGTYALSVTFTSGTTTSAPFPLSVTVGPPPAVACAPTVSPTPALSGQAFTINGNCTINGAPANAGTETWSIPAIGGQAATTVTRALPAAPLQRTVVTPGIYNFGLQFTSASGNSPAYTVPVNIAQNPATAVPDQRSQAQVADTVRANTMASMAGLRAQVSNVSSRMRTLRQGRTAGWVNDTTIQINGRSIPVPGAGGGPAGSSNDGGQSGGSAGGAPARSEEFDATQSRAWGAYIMGTVAVEELKGSNGFEVGTNGMTVGADYRFNKQAVVGGAAGYSKSSSDLSGLPDAQRATGKSFTFYGSFEPAQKWYVDTAISLSRNDFKLKRTTTLDTLANANTKGSGTGLSITTGYQFLREAFVLSPYVRADYLKVNIDGFTEIGDNALTVGDQGLKSTVITLGGEAQYIIPTGGAIVIPHARLEMQRQTQNSVRAVTAQLVGSTVQVIVDPQLETDKSFGFFSLGVSAQFKRGLSAFADYEQLFGKSNFSERRVNVGVKLEF
jgi:outer membrane autotransporter protein